MGKKTLALVMAVILVLVIHSHVQVMYIHDDLEIQPRVGEEWPMFHNQPNRTGSTQTTLTAGHFPYWIYDTGGSGQWFRTSPAIVNGCVYFGANGYLTCLNASSGTLLWNFSIEGGQIYSSPAVSDGRVFFGTYRLFGNAMFALNATTGEQIWRSTGGTGVHTSPVVAGGLVYIATNDNKMYCFNATTGVVEFQTGNHIESSLAVADGWMYFVEPSVGYMYGRNATTGGPIWRYDDVGNVNVATPTVASDKVYFVNNVSRVACLNASNGTEMWNTTITLQSSPIYSSPAVANDSVYIGDYDAGNLFCLDANNGSVLWNKSGFSSIQSSPAVSNGLVYVGSNGDGFQCINATTGEGVWNYQMGDNGMSSPAIANGRVYIGSRDGKLYCFPMVLETDSQPPTSNHPSDTTYRLNSVGHTIGWTLTDDVRGGFYEVNSNSSSGSMGIWTNGTNISIPVNTSCVGQWNYTIHYNDSVGLLGAQDEVIVTITDQDMPWDDDPVDQSSVSANSTFQSVKWTLYDNLEGGFYRVLRNDIQIVGWVIWTNGVNISVPIDTNIGFGNWNYTIQYNDSVGLWGAQDEVIVTVKNDTLIVPVENFPVVSVIVLVGTVGNTAAIILLFFRLRGRGS